LNGLNIYSILGGHVTIVQSPSMTALQLRRAAAGYFFKRFASKSGRGSQSLLSRTTTPQVPQVPAPPQKRKSQAVNMVYFVHIWRSAFSMLRKYQDSSLPQFVKLALSV
jgi:hypothetical protein